MILKKQNFAYDNLTPNFKCTKFNQNWSQAIDHLITRYTTDRPQSKTSVSTLTWTLYRQTILDSSDYMYIYDNK